MSVTALNPPVDSNMDNKPVDRITVTSHTNITAPTCSTPRRPNTMNFGKFYKTSYLDMNGNVVKKGSLSSPSLQPPTSFHRPDTDKFTYQKTTPKFGKPKKTGMLDLLRGSPTTRVSKSERRSRSTDGAKSPERPADTEAVIKLSHYPSAQVRKDVPPPIEREDWPAPPAIAVITKNLVRASHAKKYEKDSSDEEESDGTDAKIQKELSEISKIDSAMVKCIREDLTEQIKHDKKRLLDPRSASRTPSASKEPVQPPRFTSPFNASPSRSLVDRPRYVSESAAIRNSNNNAADTPVVHGAATSHRYKLKPGYSYGYVSKSLSTAPPGTPGAYVYDSFNNYSSDEEEEVGIREFEKRMHVVDLVTRDADEDDRDSVFEDDVVSKGYSYPNSMKRGNALRCSTMSDSVVFLKHLAPKRCSTTPSHVSSFDGSPFLNAINFDYRKRSESVLTLWEELLFEPDEPIPYSELNLSSENRRKGLSKSNLEKYLSNEEFQLYLGSTREEFYKLPEFKRNDIKQKAKLF